LRVLVVGGRADYIEIRRGSASPKRLAALHYRASRDSVTHEGEVQLVDHNDDALSQQYLLHNLLESLFIVATKFCADSIKRRARLPRAFCKLSKPVPGRQASPFRNRSFTNTRGSKQDGGLVLSDARIHGAFQLGFTPNHWAPRR
jgi:hypothetical protein